MKEKMPPLERNENVKLNLDRNFFDRVETLIPNLKDDEHRRNLADMNLLTKEAAFDYANRVLDQLADKSHSRRVHESLEIDFRVIGRILKQENLTPPWFDEKRDGMLGFKEIQQAKTASLLYAIRSALRYKGLTSKENLSHDEALELGKLKTSVDEEDVKTLIEKFNEVPEIHRQDLMKNLGL